MVTIELFGVPRLRAGRDAVQVAAQTLGEALRALGATCPALTPSVVDSGKLGACYLVAVNGTQFSADPSLPLADGDVVVLIASDAGG